MEKRSISAQATVLLRVFGVLGLFAVGLTVGGCGEQMSKMEDNQIRLQAMMEVQSQQMATISEHIEQRQQQLDAGIASTREETQAVGSRVRVVGEEQSEFRQMVRENDRRMAGDVAVVQKNQQKLEAEVKVAQSGTAKVGVEVAELGMEQVKLQQAVRVNGDRVAAEVSAVSKQLDEGVQSIKTATASVGADVANVRSGQRAMSEMLSNHGQQVTGKLGDVEQNQMKLMSGIEGVRQSTAKIDSDMGSAAERQVKLHQLVQYGNEQLGGRLDSLGRGHANLEKGLAGLQSDNAKVASSVADVQSGQVALQESLANNSQEMVGRMASLEQNQQKIQDGILNIESGSRKFAEEIAAFAGGQIKIERLIASGNQKLTDQVALIGQGHQKWHGQITGVQENVGQVAVVVGVLEQNLAKLQESLASGTENMVSVLGVRDRERLDFEEKIRADISAMVESITAIKQSQADLKKRISDVRITAAQMERIAEAVELLKAGTSKSAEPAPPEAPQAEPPKADSES